MVKRMLIDATHPEETRVVVLDGTRLDEFDVETSTKKQIKGNIYLAKVVRVEPSLQAAFVEYGGNRHGFLAFSEIHPDYYQVPVADRERLLADAEQHHREQDEDSTEEVQTPSGDNGATPDADLTLPQNFELAGTTGDHEESAASSEPADEGDATNPAPGSEMPETGDALPLSFFPPQVSTAPPDETPETGNDGEPEDSEFASDDAPVAVTAPGEADNAITPVYSDVETEPAATVPSEGGTEISQPIAAEGFGPDNGMGEAEIQVQPDDQPRPDAENRHHGADSKAAGIETIGGEDPEEDEEEQHIDKQRRRFVASRHYKIQEVIKRRQVMLIQVVKEERGSKGAALTTYLSLAGRYCVLMPNSARGGGVSRKITSAQDRRRLKEIVGKLDLPRNMAVILRTAGAERSKAEIKRDYEYLQRTWNSTRELTMQSRAPALIHEEASLIKRSIRDIYSRDIEEVLVDGEEGYKVAKEFMRVLTPSHARRVQRYKDENIPLFHRYQVESQIETINNPTVQLRSGGSIVFGQTEALVAIDVNSGRATRERHIEETAFKTNTEAAEEIARQLRLRDLAGLVVIDFIDMEDNRNNHAVERRLKEALRSDRARIQVGRISHFGLLELSRQRLRPSLIETNFKICGHCTGTGMVRSTESAAIHTLRVIEEEGAKRRSSEITVTVHPEVALYLLNYKREVMASLEIRYGIKIYVLGDAGLIPPNLHLERIKAVRSEENAESTQHQDAEPEPASVTGVDEDGLDDLPEDEEQDDIAAQDQEANRSGEEQESRRPRRKRRRRRRPGDSREDSRATQQRDHASDQDGQSDDTKISAGEAAAGGTERESEQSTNGNRDEARRPVRRRGRRGRRGEESASPNDGVPVAVPDPGANAQAAPEPAPDPTAPASEPASAPSEPTPARSEPEPEPSDPPRRGWWRRTTRTN